MIVYKVKIISKGFVKYLPTKYSERSSFEMTRNQSEAQPFSEEEFENICLDWVRECWNYEKPMEEMIEVELITTLASNKEEELIREQYDV